MSHDVLISKKYSNRSHYELGKDSLAQLCLVAKALYLILSDNNCLSDEKARALFEGAASAASHSGAKTGISIHCNSCARSIIYKPGQINRCIYCGKEATLNESFDATDLFLFNYLPFSFIETGITEHSSSVRESQLNKSIEAKLSRRGQMNAVNIASRSIAKYIYADGQGVSKDSQEMEHELGMKKVEKVQRLIDRFLLGLKSMWQALSDDDDQMNEALSESYYQLYKAKEGSSNNALISHVICPHCNTKNAPNQLLVITCTHCDKNFNIPLTEGFNTAVYDVKEDKYVAPTRLVENIFTLLEAILIQSQKVCPEVTYATVAAKAQQLFLENESTKDSKLCPACFRPVKTSAHNQKCLYCNSPLVSGTPGYFFDTLT